MIKSTKLISSCIMLFLLTGCPLDLTLTNNSNSNSNNSKTNSNNSSNTSYSSNSSNIDDNSSSIKTTITSSSNGNIADKSIILDFYATNDFHGRISENASESEPGIAKLATYLKDRKSENEDGYVYLNSGDYWQDTYESGHNKGKLLTECLDLMECETMSLGNHEFDWGIDVIKENKKLTTYTTFLGANIRNYPNTEEMVDFAEPYKIIERSGLKIGIIGAIGQKQITSITSSNWENITFLPHESIVKELSDELRVEKDCDVVILSIHADEEDSAGYEITQVSKVSKKKYVDAVFCAHSHQREVKYYNDVPFVQAGSHGVNLAHIQLQYNKGEVSALVAEYEGYQAMNNLEPDENIENITDKYFDQTFINEKNKVHGYISGTSTISKKHAGNILAKATYDLLEDNNVDCDIVINNGSRDKVYANEMTSEKIFNMIPFTNKTLVVENISGADIINECVNYINYYYMPDPTLEIESNKYYTVACIDYMMLHKNMYRSYDYFSSYDSDNLIYTIETYPNEIVENYLQEHGTIYTSDYDASNYNCLSY